MLHVRYITELEFRGGETEELRSGRVLTYFDRVETVGMERDYSWSFVPF